MEITKEAISEALEKTPELKKEVFELVKDTEGFVVRTKEEDEAFLANHVNATVEERVAQVLPEKINREFGEAMRKIDEKIEAVTGVKKKDGEKSTDYAHRALQESKSGDPVTKEKVAHLEKLIETKENEWKEKYQKQTELFNRKEIELQVEASLSEKQFAVPPHLKTDAEKQAYTDNQRRLLKNDFMSSLVSKKDDEGLMTFYDGDTPLLSKKDGKPLTSKDIIEEKYSHYFLKNGRQAAGAGVGAEHTGGEGGAIKSKEDVHAHLRAKGVEAGSKEYLNQFEKLCNDNSISI